MARRIVIAGLGFGGFSAARAARGQDRTAEIIVLEKRKEYDGFSPCGIPYAIEGEVPFSELIHRYSLERMGIKTMLGRELVEINPEEHRVRVLSSEGEEWMDYDSLVLATGSAPFVPSIPGVELEGVYTVSTPENGRQILDHAKQSKRAVVVGAGAIGLETAYALRKQGLDVAVVEMLDRPLPASLDSDMAGMVTKRLEEAGIRLLLGQKLEEIRGTGSVTSVVVNGMEMEADMVIMSVGVRPRVDVARQAGIEIGRGIIVDKRMMASMEDIYAVGDCVESFSLIDGKRSPCWLATAAHRQGTIAGVNAAGGNTEYQGHLCTFVSLIAGLEVAATGYSTEAAKKSGYSTVFAKAKGLSKPHWYPGAKEVQVKVVADRETGRIIGAQVIGEGAGHRVNVFSALITAGATVDSVSGLELSYSPPVSDVYDPSHTAIEVCARKMKRHSP